MAALYQVASHSAGFVPQNAVHSQTALNQISSAGDFQGSDHDSVGWRQGRVSCIGRCAGARCVVMPIGLAASGRTRSPDGRLAIRKADAFPLTRPWRVTFHEVSYERTEKLFGGKRADADASGSSGSGVGQQAPAQTVPSQQLAPLTVPSQSLPGQPARAARPAPVETPAPAPAPGAGCCICA